MAKLVRTRLVSVRLVNFKSYADYTFNLMDADGTVSRIMGLFGPNGTGKSTMQDAIGLLFQHFAGYDQERMATALQRYVRNVENPDVAGEVIVDMPEIQPQDEDGMSNQDEKPEGEKFNAAKGSKWRLEGRFITELGQDYTVVVGNDPAFYRWKSADRPGMEPTIAGLKHDHPVEVKRTLHKQCFTTRYDKELQQFQLRKDRWPVFKKLFEAVTGFPVEKRDAEMSEETMRRRDNERLALLDQYVLGLEIKKPHEVISERQCSDGERKILKSFTTVLNKDIIPSMILIDNVEMHVEVDRHITLVESIEQCFPDSQIIFTTHSPVIINEYRIDRLVSLANKAIPADQVWRQGMLRVVRGLKLAYSDEKSYEYSRELEARLNDEKFTDRDTAREWLSTLLRDGSARMLEVVSKL